MIKNNITVCESFFLKTKKIISARIRHNKVFRLIATNVPSIFSPGFFLPALKKIVREKAEIMKKAGNIINNVVILINEGDIFAIISPVNKNITDMRTSNRKLLRLLFTISSVCSEGFSGQYKAMRLLPAET
jgi:hypothetical protein